MFSFSVALPQLMVLASVDISNRQLIRVLITQVESEILRREIQVRNSIFDRAVFGGARQKLQSNSILDFRSAIVKLCPKRMYYDSFSKRPDFIK